MYFYLEWLEKKPSIITLTNERPRNINYESSFKIDRSSKEEIIICGNISNDFKNYQFSKDIKYRKNQYLSSHLQKSIRRMDSFKSIQTAKHFIDLDINSFLRRLPIIMLEDVCIHESFSIIIWLMIVVSKNYKIKNEMIQWLLGIIYYLSTELKKENYSNEIIQELPLNDNDNLLFKTLHFRKKYGGMKGDMNMIEYYKHRLNQNNQGNLIIKNDKIKLIKLTIDDLEKKDWIYQANDFHCNRYIIKQIQSYYPEYTIVELKTLIWENSSSFNKRIKNKKEKNKDWEKIRKRMKYIQMNCEFY